ncbi:MAG: TRAP transporter fused permease subunit [Armatimonadota bacterium]|nr:TRAP transporter fused permease subunit [Armatimonadota bacterium]MDR7451825.1 TRAP transporter fused permease subunit [Armatimonadota bacterium]MDR7467550.1 TRAP transporter fused permease subunit [Armatimonadota bacterium]MDR7494489.1 TRAP transporter fused permease subunit [Armatimonadota bacterium]MDR7499750.1 TRAP transporter fused permease subunit [Armatimonadota bacterium]
MGQTLTRIYRAAAFIFALVFLVEAWRAGLDLLVERPLFVLFALVLIFLEAMAKSGRMRPLELLLIVLTILSVGYVAVNADTIAYQGGIARSNQIVLAVVALVLILEATRRTIGWTLPILVFVMIGYAVGGAFIPGRWGHAGFTIQDILGYLYLTSDGMWSLPVGVAATYILVFIVLGQVMMKSGLADLLNAFAMRVAGRIRGGPAQVSVLGSLGFGMVSGSAPANVAITGSVTIPLMKRYGFPPAWAGAVEVASSAGGQLMPPVMGAAAFIMAELIRVPYAQIAVAALVPAALYYLGIGASVYFWAGAAGLRGFSREELNQGFMTIPRALRRRGHLLIPFAALIWLVIGGWHAPRAAALVVVLTILTSLGHRETRMSLGTVYGALAEGGTKTLEAAMGTAASALIYSMIVFTGIGLKFSSLAVAAAGGNTLIVLLFVVAATLILGLALPTTAAYLIAAATVAPALEQVGVPTLAAHMFIFYYSVLATITPPEGMALFTASAIAGSNWMETGLHGMKLTLSGYLVPFGFIFMPTLLLIGRASDMVLHIATAAVGIVFLSAGVMGFLTRRLHAVERLALIVGAALLFQPGMAPSLAGLAVCVLVLLRSAARGRGEPRPAEAGGGG